MNDRVMARQGAREESLIADVTLDEAEPWMAPKLGQGSRAEEEPVEGSDPVTALEQLA